MNVRDAIDLAFDAEKIAHPMTAQRPTPKEALEWVNQTLKTCGHTWITGMEARTLLEDYIKSNPTACPVCNGEREWSDGRQVNATCYFCGTTCK
jgi:hypothetical protein